MRPCPFPAEIAEVFSAASTVFQKIIIAMVLKIGMTLKSYTLVIILFPLILREFLNF
jgi:hypothetical protein